MLEESSQKTVERKLEKVAKQLLRRLEQSDLQGEQFSDQLRTRLGEIDNHASRLLDSNDRIDLNTAAFQVGQISRLERAAAILAKQAERISSHHPDIAPRDLLERAILLARVRLTPCEDQAIVHSGSESPNNSPKATSL